MNQNQFPIEAFDVPLAGAYFHFKKADKSNNGFKCNINCWLGHK